MVLQKRIRFQQVPIYIFFSTVQLKSSFLIVFSHRKKRMKTIQHKVKAGKLNVNEDDPFELFVASTNIRYCYYSETHKILGNTYGMCVLQVS